TATCSGSPSPSRSACAESERGPGIQPGPRRNPGAKPGVLPMARAGSRAEDGSAPNPQGDPMLHLKLCVAAILVVGGIVALPGRAHASAEALCYPRGGGALVNCTPLPAVCRPAGKETAACKVVVVAVANRRRNANDGGRSSVHTDVTYLLAQAA